ncbi:hypothetical protein ACA545_02185, partial [Vibrio cholerae]|uniref:hypothetical protein n=1 Tax=Vibrio cholerae TaxID=666 RepID=UPI003A100D37
MTNCPGADNTVNKAEAADKASVTLSGTVSGDAKVGDAITLTRGAGTNLKTTRMYVARGTLWCSSQNKTDK